MQLNFTGNEFTPKVKYPAMPSANEFANSSHKYAFLISLHGSSIIIEQDPFYPEY